MGHAYLLESDPLWDAELTTIEQAVNHALANRRSMAALKALAEPLSPEFIRAWVLYTRELQREIRSLRVDVVSQGMT